MDRPLRALFVEDSEDDFILMLHMLRHNGYDPNPLRVDSLLGLEGALNRHDWDVIFADFNLPTFSGLDAIRVVQRLGKDVPIIVVSGAVGEEMAATLMRAGAKDFIRKDNLARLVPAIERELNDAAVRKARRIAEEKREASERVAERAVQEVQAARELDRLRNLFINSISHELRTPLTSIIGFVELLEEGIAGSLSPGQLDYTRQILENTVRLQRLVDDLLDQARLDAGTFRLQCVQVDLLAVVRQAVDSLRLHAAASGLTLELSLPPDLPPMTLDPQRIGQVLLNLLSNAIKFTPAGGSIRMRVIPLGEQVRFEVQDTGEGLAAEELPKLFKVFSQAESSVRKGGTGLGLAISKSLVEAHGGEIGVSSTPGVGSTFYFTLPLSPEEGGRGGDRPPEPPA